MSNISAQKIGIQFLKLFFAVMNFLSFFDLRILITPLVSSNSSCNTYELLVLLIK
jgi:hypothetical protein